MIKQFTMYVPLEGDVETHPITYILDKEYGDDWLLYRSEYGNYPLNITKQCIEDFIAKGYIYDAVN